MFCRSWRPINPSEDVPFPPDRKYWRACFRPTKGVRCEKCTKALATHPDGKIRRALVREGGLDEETLRSLVFDRDAIVALHAKRQLEALELGGASEELAPSGNQSILPEDHSGKTLKVALHAKRQLEALETAKVDEVSETGESILPMEHSGEEPELVEVNEASEPELVELEEELEPIEEPEPNEKE